MNVFEVKNKGINDDIFKIVRDRFYKHPFNQTLGIELLYIGPGEAATTLSPEPRYSTLGSRVHGGIISAMMDNVMGVAGASLSGHMCRTIDMNTKYIAPAFEQEELVTTGYVIHADETLIVIEGCINCKGRIIAQSCGTFIRDSKYNPFDRK